MRFFPDSCFKKQPPKAYFWKVYYVCFGEKFTRLVQNEISSLRDKHKIKEDKIKLSAEAFDVFNEFNFDKNLGLLCKLISKAYGRTTNSCKRN